MITGFYAGLLGLWLVFLIMSVVRLRWKYRVGLGDGGEQELARAVRVHGNFTETVPMILIIMGLMEYAQAAPVWALHGFGVVLVVSRVLHWRGLGRQAGASFGRTAGTVSVNLLLVCGAAVLIYAFLQG